MAVLPSQAPLVVPAVPADLEVLEVLEAPASQLSASILP